MHKRDDALDLMRGLAIIMMVIFHFIYDLNYFGFIDINLHTNKIGIYWRYLIVFLFLLAVGISMVISYKIFDIDKFINRILLLGFCATSISLITYLLFPQSWIYFGIIHLICVSSIITIFFINKPNISLIITIAILALSYFDIVKLSFIYKYLSNILPKNTLDFYPLFPWIAIIFLGIYLGHNRSYYQKIFFLRNKSIQMLGRHSMMIYMLHQVILFTTIFGVYKIINA